MTWKDTLNRAGESNPGTVHHTQHVIHVQVDGHTSGKQKERTLTYKNMYSVFLSTDRKGTAVWSDTSSTLSSKYIIREEMLIKLVEYLYISVGNRVYRQSLGTDCAPLPANVFL